ncbi:ABC transporter ATP-binding protein [Marinovum sp. 2_MG-2023]|uniref:dipeptide ABC transporter ATP-binding protein n=2 Tax=Bacteria TaxID=2 RepID=UPI0026E44CBF|nr:MULTISPECIES: ABC transporter ATP-binding protein [unclassified Marinovum]MDO6729000.1 ABC transporter ATP-binding protein [Marinovum sp. 2_MG-2023]MDO6779373.1 ABC transporter ATP-binding protein [Marinovum sp. 1_MG-2023]
MSALLNISNLNVSIKLPHGTLSAVRDTTITLQKGRSLGIVGESGSGKSMTALSLMRLLPRSGDFTADAIEFDGTNLLALDDRRFAETISGPGIGMIFQEPMTSLNPVYTIGRQMTEAAVWRGMMSAPAARTKAIALLDRVGIPDPEGRMSQYPHQMSGGQRQRVMIAMTLMLDPKLLIADEPTTALDVTVQAQILDLLDDLRRERDMGMILISHDLAVVAQRTDAVAVMYGGEMIEQGPAEAVLRRPAHPYTQSLLNAIPQISGAPGRLGAIPGLVPSIMQATNTCIFAPRCAHAHAVCTAQRPPSRAQGGGHMCRCVLDTPPTIVTSVTPLRASAPQPDTEPVLSARDVTRVYTSRRGMFGPKRDIRALDGVSLDLRKGETLALIGESGSGKSTLARILLGLDHPTSGAVFMGGRPVAEVAVKDRAHFVQPVFQDPYSSLNPRRRLAEIIARPLELSGHGTAAENDALVRSTLELVRLPLRLLHAYPSQLSGGQRQRVAIARALVTKPQVLVCDEPTSALDVSIQAQILNLLDDLKAEMGLTCLFITHDMAVVHQIADRVVVMLKGQVVEEGAARQVLRQPKNDYTRRLVAAAPRFEAKTEEMEIVQ